MDRNELINKLKENFYIQELVCPHCYERFGEDSWLFLSTELLSVLYTLRYIIFNAPITVNTWDSGGRFDERGLRCNQCDLVKSKNRIYLSAHCLGKAIDFNVKDKTSDEVNEAVLKNAHLFEYPIRLELNTNGWSHVDVYQPVNSNKQLVGFNG